MQRLVDRHGPNLFYRSVEQRLLCCNVRKVQPLTKHLGGIDAWVTGLRRDQWAGRTDIRKVEIDHDHGAIVKLNPLAEWTEDEVWDYVRENDVPVHPLYAQGYTSIGCAPCTRPIAAGGADASRPLVVGVGSAPRSAGCTARSRRAGSSTKLHAISARTRTRMPTRSNSIAVKPEEREVALGEVQAVLEAARDEGYRARLAAVVTSVEQGELAAEEATALEQVLELGLQAGRIPRCTGRAASRRRSVSSGGCPPAPGSPRRRGRSPRRSRR